jgi:hypothetical protein
MKTKLIVTAVAAVLFAVLGVLARRYALEDDDE